MQLVLSLITRKIIFQTTNANPLLGLCTGARQIKSTSGQGQEPKNTEHHRAVIGGSLEEFTQARADAFAREKSESQQNDADEEECQRDRIVHDRFLDVDMSL